MRPARTGVCWRGCRRLPSNPLRQRGPCSSVVVVSQVRRALSPGPGPQWCHFGRGALGRCQGVPQVRSPWRASVAGTSDRRRWWAGDHRTPEGRRPVSFLHQLPGCLHLAPAVVARPPRRGGLAASQPEWGAPWRIGPVSRVAGVRFRGWCSHARHVAGGFDGFVPPSPVRAAGLLRVPIAGRPRCSVPLGADRPVTLRGRRQMSFSPCRHEGKVYRVRSTCVTHITGRKIFGGVQDCHQ